MKTFERMIAVAVLSGAFAAGAEDFELKGDAAKGEAPYKTYCVTCHGVQGDGAGPAGAALNPHPTNFTDPANAARLTPEYAYNVVNKGGAANGRSALMVAWSPTLTDAQIRDVVAYVLKFKPAAKPEAKPAGKKAGKK